LVVVGATCNNWSTFLNSEFEEEVYVSQPLGFEVTEKESCLYKALYGPK